MLGQVSTVHRATDASLWKKACPKGGDIAIKSVIEVAKASRQIFFGLGG